ncbi:MAG: M55 family metallopeptidase [Omnitrophica WOR_2 bacterium]
MKLLIACDMEGISGVVDWNHVDSTHTEYYNRYRKIMTGDVNAAIAGAANMGIEDIIVADGHGYAKNILIEELDQRARLNSGSPSPFAMVQGIDSGVSAVFFIGYHAHMSTQNAILAHTWSSAKVSNVWLNDRIAGEIGLNASVCGHFGAPVLLISGDEAACQEANEWMPGIETVPVKKASGRQSAECLPTGLAQQRIRDGAERAIKSFQNGQAPVPLKTESPVKISIEFLNTLLTDRASLVPGVERQDARRIVFTAVDMVSAYKAFRAAVEIA